MPFIESLPYTPQSIVSLVPSQTELLFELGLGSRIAGVTKFCIHPAAAVKPITKVGGTKNFRFETIHQLRPDLILGNKEENYQEGLEQLAETYPVWVSDIYTLEDALAMIRTVGTLTGAVHEATKLAGQIQTAFSEFSPVSSGTAAYFIWKKPYMVAGSQTFIHDMLRRCGFVNVFGDLPRYPQISEAQLQQAAPQYVLLSSEPYPFKEKDLREFKAICPQAEVLLVDGEMFSWYGSRLLQSIPYFRSLVNGK